MEGERDGIERFGAKYVTLWGILSYSEAVYFEFFTYSRNIDSAFIKR